MGQDISTNLILLLQTRKGWGHDKQDHKCSYIGLTCEDEGGGGGGGE